MFFTMKCFAGGASLLTRIASDDARVTAPERRFMHLLQSFNRSNMFIALESMKVGFSTHLLACSADYGPLPTKTSNILRFVNPTL